jgi:hypothetical protein
MKARKGRDARRLDAQHDSPARPGASRVTPAHQPHNCSSGSALVIKLIKAGPAARLLTAMRHTIFSHQHT